MKTIRTRTFIFENHAIYHLENYNRYEFYMYHTNLPLPTSYINFSTEQNKIREKI